MASVKLKNLCKVYDDGFKAVKNFNLDIEDKDFVVFVGPSGCGKSTTLRMIAGLESISLGDLYIENQKVNNKEAKDRDIAMVFQNYALYPHMSVYDNMAFSLKLRKLSKDEVKSKVIKTAKILDIESLLKRKPKQLSGGQRQRVALGRAIVRNPKVFLMDEPLSNLDAKLRVQMRNEIIKLHKQLEATVIYVTHDQVEAMTMGNKIVVINEGEIQQVGTPFDIYNKPKNKFVASFIGSPQMNFIKCDVKKNNQNVYLKFYDFDLNIDLNMQKILESKKYIDKKIILGVRPEDIILEDKSTNKKINGVIDRFEFLGAEEFIYIKVLEDILVSRVVFTKKDYRQNEVNLKFKKVHLFDIKTKENIELD